MENIKFIAYYLKKQNKILLIIAALCTFLAAFLILPYPLIIKNIIDVVLPNSDMNQLIVYSLLLIFVCILKYGVTNLQGALFYKINATLLYHLRVDLLKKISFYSIKEIQYYGTGYYISRIHEDTQKIGAVMADSLLNIVKNIITVVIGFIAMLYINKEVTILCICLFPMYLFFMRYYSHILRNKSKLYLENNAIASKQLEESLNIIELGKIFQRYDYIVGKYKLKAKNKLDANVAVGKINFLGAMVTDCISGMMPLCIIAYGGYKIINGELLIGELVALVSLVNYITDPLSDLANVNGNIQQSMVALARIKNIINQKNTIENVDYSNENIDDIKYIKFNNVSFAYNRKKILNKINVDFIIGQKIGIVGKSGTGKTTILKLLTGLYKISDGNIEINGIKATINDMIYLRKNIAIVDQNPVLLNDTIANNIKFGKRNATQSDVEEVAKKACIDDFIKSLPNTYNTILNPNGNNLSIGQKQRLAIARALIKRPKILLLDEITSNIDNASEAYINNAIFDLPRNMLVVIIAHRLSSIKKCDTIYFLDNGEIMEHGTHAELMQMGGLYAKNWNKSE
jgi:ABC-type multidrug transport system fused ATPase/permease subunit